MTLRELTEAAGDYGPLIAAIFVALPALAFLLGKLHPRAGGGLAPWRFMYSALIYLVCVPGLLAAVLTGYTLFFTGESLLDVDALVYLLPLVSMVTTLALISRNVSFDDIPGFDRLAGLMTMIGVSFALALAIQKTRIWVIFGGSITALLVLAAAAFALLRWGTYMLFRRRDEPAIDRPRLPDL